MLTIFTIPKPFQGHNKIIQNNAIRSWLQLEPKCEVVLFGDDDGVAEAAKEFGVQHIPDIEKNEFGTPLLNSAFYIAQQNAKNQILMYVNADILFLPDLIEAINKINFSLFLVCGRRWDLDIKDEMDFGEATWRDELQAKVNSEGVFHGLSGMDYFVFRRNSIDMLPFAVGRPGWDAWLIYHMRYKKIPVINASRAITAVHQNHDYSHSKFGEKKRVGGPEWEKNIKIAGGHANLLTMRDADWILDQSGLGRPNFPERLFSLLALWYPYRLLLALKRKIQKVYERS